MNTVSPISAGRPTIDLKRALTKYNNKPSSDICELINDTNFKGAVRGLIKGYAQFGDVCG